MDFMIGCNYWASNAGTDMWRDFDASVVKKDLQQLSEYGVRYMRVFPNWRDFQPVKPNYTQGGRVFEYVMENGCQPTNEYFLDESMLEHFSEFLDLCDQYRIRVIVGLITGWMSGGLFVPSALYGKNVLTDSTALYFEQLFIKGFVQRFRDRKTVYAWDLGNECNCMGAVDSRYQAVSWTATVANAIRAADPTRPVVSGMHGLSLRTDWRIQDQAQFTDILTTHPYPYWCAHTSVDETLSFRTTMHATTETKWYADIGGKPCLAEEIGTMGPMVCSDDHAADFLRLNLFSLWANGAAGAMWWCAHEQSELDIFPYTTSMVERELGLLNESHQPKPVLREMKAFADWLADTDIALPKAAENGVCLLTQSQDHWGVAYMTYALAKKVGLNLKFSYAMEQELPESDLYLLPSVSGNNVMHKDTYDQLKQRVRDGADVYLSLGQTALQGFEEFTGLSVEDSYIHPKTVTAQVAGKTVTTVQPQVRTMRPTTAQVLAVTDDGRPFITVNVYGKGRVFVVDAPVESHLLTVHDAFDGQVEAVYNTVFADRLQALPVALRTDGVVATYHPLDDGAYVVAINHSGEQQTLTWELKEGYEIQSVLYGDAETVRAYDACVLQLKKHR